MIHHSQSLRFQAGTDFIIPKFYGAINRIGFFKSLLCMKLLSVNPEFLRLKAGMTARFLSHDELIQFSKEDQSYELSENFIHSAMSAGSECYGILHGDRLAAYGWYAKEETPITGDLSFQFRPDHIYMYKGFTHSDYRGQRLHGYGMNLALREYLQRGYLGLVSYVEVANRASLQSVHRLGYSDIGTIHMVRTAGRYWIYVGKECKNYGVSVRCSRPEASFDGQIYRLPQVIYSLIKEAS